MAAYLPKYGLILFLLGSLLISCGCISPDGRNDVLTPVPTIPGPSIAEIEGINVDAGSMIVYDSAGRQVAVPRYISHVICLGEGCVSLLVMLDAHDLIAAVDKPFLAPGSRDTNEYQSLYPGLFRLPAVSDESGVPDLDRISMLSPAPDVIFSTHSIRTDNPDELQAKTGIPVIVTSPGDLNMKKDEFENSLRLLGTVLQKRSRSEAVILFFRTLTGNLQDRTIVLSKDLKKTAYVGGSSFGYTRDILDTTPGYLPFILARIDQIPSSIAITRAELADDGNTVVHISLTDLVAEKPDAVFIDLATLKNADNAITELRTYPTYTRISAISDGSVYGLFPSQHYGFNYGSVIANAYFLGKMMYPDKFTDVNPEKMADDIFTFLYGAPLFEEMDQSLQGFIFQKIPLV
ncbi:MAG: ABC transporter substrate-binding protein [Methanospirillaceae archaeon]|nr:ABC transporter substrate-binding protein [Methanospirillaceae archaeon]